MALAQLEREDAPVLHLERLEDVGDQLELAVVAHQARIAVDHEEPRVAAAADQAVQRAAVLAGLFRCCTTSGCSGRRFSTGGSFPAATRRRAASAAPTGVIPRKQSNRQGEQQLSRSHQIVFMPPSQDVLCRCPACPGASSPAMRNSAGQAAGSEALPSISASKSSLRPRSGSGTAASSALRVRDASGCGTAPRPARARRCGRRTSPRCGRRGSSPPRGCAR